MAGSPKKASKVEGNTLKALAARLSALGGKVDSKLKGDDGKPLVIRESPAVFLGEGDDGERAIKLPGVFSTRCATLDAAIGRGGIPMARITTIAGGEAGGKTTIALHTLAECQAMGGIGLYIDNEHKLDTGYAKALGVDLKRALITQPGTIEDAFNIMNAAILDIHRNDPDQPVFVVLDSINASRSEKEYEEDGTADFTQSNQGGLAHQARIMSERLPKIARLLSNRRAALLMISQPRDNVGYAGKNLIAGGNAPRFYSALVISIKNAGEDKWYKERGQNVGNNMIAECVKNQVAKPHQQAEFTLRWGQGIDTQMALVAQAVKQGLISPGAQQRYEMIDPTKPESMDIEKRKLKWQGAKGWHQMVTKFPHIRDYIMSELRKGF